MTTDRVSFYRVPFACSVPGLGCGPLARPALLALESSPSVEGAWLHRMGTTMAVAWNTDASHVARDELIRTVMGERHFSELNGSDREAAERSFLAGLYWYQGNDVDRLTEEEARVIAFGLVRETKRSLSLPNDREKQLELGLAAAILEALLRIPMQNLGRQWLSETLSRWMTKQGQESLSEVERAALQRAVIRRGGGSQC